MTKINFNHKRPYKHLPDSELHQIKNDTGENPKQRAIAEAELSFRDRFWPRVIAIATVITAIVATVTLLKMFLPKSIIFPPTPNTKPIVAPSTQDSNKGGNPGKLIEPKVNIIHKTPTNEKNK
ncbi:MAG: hypothetical protein V1897_05785 [Pseudomonadota bacterium]